MVDGDDDDADGQTKTNVNAMGKTYIFITIYCQFECMSKTKTTKKNG